MRKNTIKKTKKTTVLFLHIGVDLDKSNAHDDYLSSVEYVRSDAGVQVIERNFITDDLAKVFQEYNICAVDTHHLRLWQKRWDSYKPRFEILKELADMNNAVLINDLSMFEWNICKAHYMSMLEKNGIKIVPTNFISSAEARQVKLSNLAKESPNGIVVKPSIGMRASGITFIEKSDEKYKLTQPTTPDDAKGDQYVEVYNRLLNEEELNSWFFDYATTVGKDAILVQQMITERKEVSIIFIEGSAPYAILRTQGAKTGVAHEAFGGKNIALTHIPQDLLDFSKAVIEAMPAEIKAQAMHRIDVLITSDQNQQSPFMLLEVESAGPRLFVPESGTYAYFPELLIRTAKRQYKLNKVASKTSFNNTVTSSPITASALTETYSYLNFIENAQLSAAVS